MVVLGGRGIGWVESAHELTTGRRRNHLPQPQLKLFGNAVSIAQELGVMPAS